MCKFYSAIVMKNGDILHDVHLTSHEDIIDLYNLKDDTMRQNFVRVELAPEDVSDLPDITKYHLNVDERSTPEWFEKHKEYVESRLKDIVSKRIITSDQKLLTGGLYIIKDCQIDRITCAVVVYMQNSRVSMMRGNSQVNVMRENSQVDEMWENSQVNEMRGNSRVSMMLENSQVDEMWENSQVNEMWENSQVNEMLGNSQVNVMRENSRVNKNNSLNKLPSK